MSFQSEGAGESGRALFLTDASKAAGGIPEKDELGGFKSLVVGFVDIVQEGLITKEVQARLQPRNWHFTEGPPFFADLPNVKDRRAAVALIADHEHDFPGWALDQNEKSALLDDWFYDQATDAIQKSTRIVDYKDPKGRAALLAQLLKVTDDHLQQYTAALVLGREIGDHEIAAGGYVWDGQRLFNGLLDTFWITRHADAYGAGREGTPFGILSERTDAHFDWPNSAEHGRIKFRRIDLSQVPEGAVKYKSWLGWDPTVANEDSEIGKENGQWRPVYHCIDSPEKDPRRPPPPPGEPGIPPPPPPPPDPNPPSPGMPVPPDPPPTFVPNDDLIVGLEELKKLLREDEINRRPPPFDQEEGRVICLPLSHHPPLRDGLKHPEHGYLCMSQDREGRRVLWVDSRRVEAPALGAFWERVVTVPKDVPAGLVAVSDGRGGWTWNDPLRPIEERPTGEGPIPEEPVGAGPEPAGPIGDRPRDDETTREGPVRRARREDLQ